MLLCYWRIQDFCQHYGLYSCQGYSGETEGPVDEAKEWPVGSGFSHLWGGCGPMPGCFCLHRPTFLAAGSVGCWKLTEGPSLGIASLLMEGLALPNFYHLFWSCLHVTDRCWGYKGLAPWPPYKAPLKDLPNLRGLPGISWGLSCNCHASLTLPFAQFCFSLLWSWSKSVL